MWGEERGEKRECQGTWSEKISSSCEVERRGTSKRQRFCALSTRSLFPYLSRLTVRSVSQCYFPLTPSSISRTRPNPNTIRQTRARTEFNSGFQLLESISKLSCLIEAHSILFFKILLISNGFELIRLI